MGSKEAESSSSPPEEQESTGLASPSKEIPNGGLGAWLQVAGGFILQFNTWGIANSFGVFQAYYQTTALPYETPGNISWIGSLQVFLLMLGGLLAGPVFDMGYLRTLLFTGVFAICFAMFMVGLCSQYWQFVLAQGLVMGFGFGCLFLPTITIVAQYFTTKKAIAFGIATLGASIGGILYPLIFRQLEPRVGFGWTTRIIAFIMLATSAIPLIFMRQRTIPGRRKKLTAGLGAYKSRLLTVYAVANFFGFMGVYIALYYTQLYALSQTDADKNLASYLLSMINAGTIVGRVVPNYFADKIEPLYVQIASTVCAAILSFCWIAVRSSARIVAFSVLYGIAAGPFNSLPGMIIIGISPDLSTIGLQIGVSLAVAGAGSLIGEPIAGALLRTQAGWTALQVWAGSLLTVCALLCIYTKVLKNKRAAVVKV